MDPDYSRNLSGEMRTGYGALDEFFTMPMNNESPIPAYTQPGPHMSLLSGHGVPPSWQSSQLPEEQEEEDDVQEVTNNGPMIHDGRSRRGTRGPNFSTAEDRLIVSSWLEVSLDPIVGASQSGGSFWGRIKANFDMYKDSNMEERTERSIETRWGVIQKEVNKFTGCVKTIERRNQSGATISNKVLPLSFIS